MSISSRYTAQSIVDKKSSGEKIIMLTAYDFTLASIVDGCGVDMILVGDSLANVALGLDSTREVDLETMLMHTKAVNRAVRRALVVGDMPFAAYQTDTDASLRNARRFVDEAGCGAVKLEWFERCLEVAARLVREGIPVMGHIGLTPQTAGRLGGLRVQGREAESALAILAQARELEQVGCFAVVLECVPDRIARRITEDLKIPTIGIGAGPACDGQVLVTHDLCGLTQGFRPKFVKRFVEAGDLIRQGIQRFQSDVGSGVFPDQPHSFSISEEEWRKIEAARDGKE